MDPAAVVSQIGEQAGDLSRGEAVDDPLPIEKAQGGRKLDP
jgi:hypothetical protein